MINVTNENSDDEFIQAAVSAMHGLRVLAFTIGRENQLRHTMQRAAYELLLGKVNEGAMPEPEVSFEEWLKQFEEIKEVNWREQRLTIALEAAQKVEDTFTVEEAKKLLTLARKYARVGGDDGLIVR